MQANIHPGLGSSHGALAFGRDMFLGIPLIADWLVIQQRREQLVNESLRRQNKIRQFFDYGQGHQVLKRDHLYMRLGPRTKGPYHIERVHTNGTLTIRLCP